MKNVVILIFLLSCLLVTAQKNKSTSTKVTSEKSGNQEHLPRFMQFGIMSKDHETFKKKYGITVNYQNCVISEYLAQKARENNKLVAKILTEKYGNTWKKDLGFIPYGL